MNNLKNMKKKIFKIGFRTCTPAGVQDHFDFNLKSLKQAIEFRWGSDNSDATIFELLGVVDEDGFHQEVGEPVWKRSEASYLETYLEA